MSGACRACVARITLCFNFYARTHHSRTHAHGHANSKRAEINCTVFLLSSHSATTCPGGSPSTGSPGTVFLLSSHSIQVNQKSLNKKTLKV